MQEGGGERDLSTLCHHPSLYYGPLFLERLVLCEGAAEGPCEQAECRVTLAGITHWCHDQPHVMCAPSPPIPPLSH